MYCGLRASNKQADRYRLQPEEILACCAEGMNSVIGPLYCKVGKITGLQQPG